MNTLDRAGLEANFTAYATSLRGCGNAQDLLEGKRVHALLIKRGRERDRFLGNLLILMYCKCGALKDARDLLFKLDQRNVFSWAIMIGAYAQHKLEKDALQLFIQMHVEGVIPDKVTFVTILSVCARQAALAQGKQIHVHIVHSGLESDVIIGTALVNMYSKCGCLENAQMTFDLMPERNVVSWTAMISLHATFGHGRQALMLFQKMQMEGVAPNEITFVSLFEACASHAALSQGQWIHACIAERAIHAGVVVGNALVNMYGKCDSLEDAWSVFNKMLERDVVSWTAMIAACVQHGHHKDACWLFETMKMEGNFPDRVTFISMLDACACQTALAEGKQIHVHVVGIAHGVDVVLGTALINMYGKCGRPEDSRIVFDNMLERNLVMWNAIIAAYAQHGRGEEVLKLFDQMDRAGVAPDNVTFFSILSSCSHAGLVDEGYECFVIMHRHYGISPAVEHYNCIIGLLVRAGRLNEGEQVMKNMPFQPTSSTWMAILGACKMHSDVVQGKDAAGQLVELYPESISPYILLSNICNAASDFADAAMLKICVLRSNLTICTFEG